MEGPSLVILKEESAIFRGKKILEAKGYADIDYDRLKNKVVKDIKTWGKIYLLVFPGFSLRIHFLLFGSYLINERNKANAKVSLRFANGELNCYICSAKILEGPVEDWFDWRVDLLSPKWSFPTVKKLVKDKGDLMIGDVIMDPNIFSGAGNIIKNEALYRAGIQPESVVEKIPGKKLDELIKAVRSYSKDFLKWRKLGVLAKHWIVYNQKICRECGEKVKLKITGKLKRRSFICPHCQQLYK